MSGTRRRGGAWQAAGLMAAAAGVCALAAVGAAPSTSSGQAAGQMRVEKWPDTPDGFAKCAERIQAVQGRNLLGRRGVKVSAAAISTRELTDGQAGQRGGDGRANVGGHPTVIRYYLGEVKPIHEIGVVTFNGDGRSNQDWEVRLADGGASPGKPPAFPDEPAFTTGPKVLGAEGGGYRVSFAAPGGGPIGKADWVEYRIWATHGAKVGEAAKTGVSRGWCAVIELEVFSHPEDAITISAEELARRKALASLGARPAYEKKTTWQETMAAAREALLRWECELDRLALADARVSLGDWHALPPLDADSKALAQLERAKSIDVGKPLELAGQANQGGAAGILNWRKCPEIRDGEMADLARLVGSNSESCSTEPGQVIALCRELSVEALYDGADSFVFGVGAAAGSLRTVGGKSALRIAAPAFGVVPNQESWALKDGPGGFQVLALLPVGADGACRFWFVPQPTMSSPGAGPLGTRTGRRRDLFNALERDFTNPLSRVQMRWERQDSIWVRYEKRDMARREFFLTDWAPGSPDAVLTGQYNRFAAERAVAAEKELATIEPAIAQRVGPWLRQFRATPAPAGLAGARGRYYAVAAVQLAMKEHHGICSMRLAVQDQRDTFGDKYPRGAEYLGRIGDLERRMEQLWPKLFVTQPDALGELLALREAAAGEAQAILLDNPLLRFEKLLMGRGGPGFASNWGGANSIGNELVILSPVRPDGQIATVYKGGHITDMDLSFDAAKVLFCEDNQVAEVGVDGSGRRQITRQTDPHVKHYDACRLPNGKIIFASTACEQAVPCTGEWYVGNLHIIDDDGTNERRLTYDQDHDWNPCLLNNGQVIYARWEYTDIPHYFSRLLFTMNPDGTAQSEYYGSNSYWPNAMYWPRPIPGHPTRVACVVSGHHGVARVGELVILDNAQGRHEADGVVQRIGDRGKRVEPVILDGLVGESWPRYAWPWPLAEPATNRGAGRYFLVNAKLDEWSPWGIYLADVFDNLTPVLIGNYAQPIPLVARPAPPAIPPRVDLSRKDALVYMSDVYQGGGLRGFPRGSVRSLRVGAHVYRYGGNGDTRSSSHEGGWDIKRILGSVPVEPDGSAYFRVPANMPIFVQPLDEEGQALQVMRSWFVAMPGEVLSCVGCHERQSLSPPVSQAAAPGRMPSEIEPWHGAARGFGFDREVQPVLDRRCAGCHDGRRPGLPDLRAKRLHVGFSGPYSPAYMALAAYVRRPGYESDYHLPAPAEWRADTSPLIQLLKKGHQNVRLTAEEWGRLHAWIDFNVPYPANWGESHQPPMAEQVERRAKYRQLYAGIAASDEEPLELPSVASFEPPEPEPPRPPAVPMDGWPLTAAQAAAAQKAAGLPDLTLDLGDGVTMALAPIPAGRFIMGHVRGTPDERPEAAVVIPEPFHMGRLEVTNRQYARFDSDHDSGYMDARGKDRINRGYPVNEPNQPAVRVSWHEAMAFCRWLSAKTGRLCTLPTEAEWEYACRAGTATPWSFGDSLTGRRNLANLADSTLAGWAFGRAEGGYSDGQRFSVPGGLYPPNAWGLYDMHGNVAEWTLSDHRPYPYVAGDGRNEPPSLSDPAPPRKVIRGGSWNDKADQCRSAGRWSYAPHQPAYNVGLRILCRPGAVARAPAR